MTPVLTLLCACYALFIRLCPGPFRAAFEEEMKDTFAQAAAEATGGGTLVSAGRRFGARALT